MNIKEVKKAMRHLKLTVGILLLLLLLITGTAQAAKDREQELIYPVFSEIGGFDIGFWIIPIPVQETRSIDVIGYE